MKQIISCIISATMVLSGMTAAIPYVRPYFDPTPTRLAIAQTIAACNVAGSIKPIGAFANIRSGRGTQFRDIGDITDSRTVEAAVSGWYRLCDDRGYVSALVVVFTATTTETPTPTRTSTPIATATATPQPVFLRIRVNGADLGIIEAREGEPIVFTIERTIPRVTPRVTP